MFEKKEFSQILEAMQGSLQDKSSREFDFQEGSVVRTLFESFAYEMAVLYEQMERVYLSAYVDSSEDTDLDKVVAILGIKRGEPEYATGKVTFERDVGIDEAIEIPIDTLVTTEDTETSPKKAYKTIEPQTIAEGESSVTVRVQAEDFGQAGETEAETIVVMPQPVSGVKSVSNQKAVQFRGKERETDRELRDRAKETLLAASGANSTSIKNTLLAMPGVKEVKIKEPFEEQLSESEDSQQQEQKAEIYGLIDVFVDAVDFDNVKPQLQSRIDRVRAAGVFVRLQEPTKVEVDVLFQVTLDPQLKFSQDSERQSFEESVEKAIRNYLERLTIGQPLVYTQFIRHLLELQGVSDLSEVAIAIYENGQRKEYILSDLAANKQIAITDSGKIFPRRIRVTSGTQRLPLLIPIEFQFTELEGITRQDIINFLNNYFQSLEQRKSVILTKTEILEHIKNNQINENTLEVIEDSFKLFPHNPQEQVAVSYLEQAQVDEENLFAFCKIIKLIGAIKFTPAETSTIQERESDKENIQRQITSYLNNLKPQEAIDLNNLRETIQKSAPKLTIAELVPDDFRIVLAEQEETRLDNNQITVREFEKAKFGHFCITTNSETVNVTAEQLQLTVMPSESSPLAKEIIQAVSEEVNKAVSQAQEITNKANTISQQIRENAISEELRQTSSQVEEVIDTNNPDSGPAAANQPENTLENAQDKPTLSDEEETKIKQSAIAAINNFSQLQQGVDLKYQEFKQTIETAVNELNLPTLKEANHVLQVTKLNLTATSTSDQRTQNITIEQPKDIHIRSVEIINSIRPPSVETIEII